MATIETIKTELARMMAIWGHMLKMDENLMRIRNQEYARQLADIDDAMLSAAVQQLIAESDFYPSIAAIRKKAQEIALYSDGGPVDAMEVFGRVLNMAGAIGRDANKDQRRRWLQERFPARVVDITMRCIDSLTWYHICNETDDRMDTMRAQWRGIFNSLQEREQQMSAYTPAVRAYISGLAEKLAINAPRKATNSTEDSE